MTAVRWVRRTLDLLLVAAIAVVAITAGITLLAPALGGRAMVIGGGSMEPAIDRGALVLALPAGAEGYAVGDVVTIHQGAATPYTHRITRLTEHAGEPYIETKGDANAHPDAVIVPTAAIIGRVVMQIPLLGYLSLLLGTAAGLAGFLAIGAAGLFIAWFLEDLEVDQCPACAAGAGADSSHDPSHGATPTPAGVPAGAAAMLGGGVLAALPSFALPVAPSRVRQTGRARPAATPVLLEADRRNPRRHGRATAPAVREGADGPPIAQPGAAADPESRAA